MSRLSRRLLGGLLALIRRTRAETDLDAELQAFLDASIDDKVRAGMAPDAARRAARMELGSAEAVKDRVRDVGWESIAEGVWRDLRYAVRMLRRSYGFSTVAILSLALGIGANTAIFTLINALSLRPLPVREPGELVELLSRYPGEPRVNAWWWRHYEHFRDRNQVFASLIGQSPARFQLTAEGLEAHVIDGQYVVGDFFSALGVEPGLGRLIGGNDDQPGADAAVAVFSWRYWQARFNGDPAVVGRRIVLDGVPLTVIGVAPEAFSGLQAGLRPDIWVPVAVEPLIQQPSRRADGTLSMQLLARVTPGVSLEQAHADMAVLDRWRVEDLVATKKAPYLNAFIVELEPAAAGFTALRDRFGSPLFVLMALVGVLLLVACGNIASLLLARAAARQREMALRVSLGAGRLRVMQQVMIESLLLSTIAAGLGVGLAYFGVNALVRILVSDRGLASFGQRFALQVTPDERVLLVTALIAVATALLFGMAPAWYACTSTPAPALRTSGTAGETRSRRAFGMSLVAAQVALSMVLLSASGLFIRHLVNLRSVGLGFEHQSVLLMTLDPARSGRPREQLFEPYRLLLDRLRAIPGVQAASLSAVTPVSGAGAARMVDVEGFQEAPEARKFISINWVAPRYFETLRTPLLAGRDFDFADRGKPWVAIVNQAVARYYFAERDPIGRQLRLEGQDRWYEIVGVVGDAKYLDLRGREPRTVYLNVFQEPRMVAHQFSIRTDGGSVAGAAQRAAHEVLANVPVTKVTTLTEQVDASIVPERLVATLAGLFGVLGAVLAGIGLYGLLAYTVARRTNEIGIRMALGATRMSVIGQVVKGTVALVGAGVLVGAPVAIWSRQFAANLLDGLPAGSALTVALAAAAMLVVAFAASYLPARRAASVDPTEALRCE